jgi:hypothetical protein
MDAIRQTFEALWEMPDFKCRESGFIGRPLHKCGYHYGSYLQSCGTALYELDPTDPDYKPLDEVVEEKKEVELPQDVIDYVNDQRHIFPTMMKIGVPGFIAWVTCDLMEGRNCPKYQLSADQVKYLTDMVTTMTDDVKAKARRQTKVKARRQTDETKNIIGT